MAKARKYWFWTVKKMIQLYPTLKSDNSVMSKKITKAVEEALEEIKNTKDGDYIYKAVNEVLIKKTKTVNGVAMDLNYSWPTVRNWMIKFVVLVGNKLGF